MKPDASNISSASFDGPGAGASKYLLYLRIRSGSELADFLSNNGIRIRKYPERISASQRISNLIEALPIVEQIGKGLDYAHGRGVLHLDLKPDNIMLTNQGEIKLMDFSLSRVVNAG